MGQILCRNCYVRFGRTGSLATKRRRVSSCVSHGQDCRDAGSDDDKMPGLVDPDSDSDSESESDVEDGGEDVQAEFHPKLPALHHVKDVAKQLKKLRPSQFLQDGESCISTPSDSSDEDDDENPALEARPDVLNARECLKEATDDVDLPVVLFAVTSALARFTWPSEISLPWASCVSVGFCGIVTR